MRIIGGKAKGRRLRTPGRSTGRNQDQFVRPTADRAREALFSIIAGEIQNAVVLDLFAGTGALGLEALSRGAAKAVFIDTSSKAVQLINENIRLCGFTGETAVFKRDLFKGLAFLKNELSAAHFSVVFADPPYRKNMAAAILDMLSESGLLNPQALVLVEEDAHAGLPEQVDGLTCFDQRRYGDTGFWFYRFSPEK